MFPLFYENATEAYLAGCAVLSNNTGKHRRQLSLPMAITTLVNLLEGSVPLTAQQSEETPNSWGS